MKFIISFLMLGAVSSKAGAYEISCQSAQFMVKVISAGPDYNAVVLEKNSMHKWVVVYAEPVTKSTTRGTNLLFLGEGFGLGIARERNNSSRLHRGTLRLWNDATALEEQVDCHI